MQFTTFAYLGFFCAVFAAHWALPPRWRWAACLIASLAFYTLLGPAMLAVLLLCTCASWLGGLWLQKKRGQRHALALAVLLALVPLFFFKYFDALLGAAMPQAVRSFSLVMPLGLSFYTFKIIAYLAEVYRGSLDACRHAGRYALYVSFFPEVSMGPIQRPGPLLGQIAAPRAFDCERALRGAQLVLWGYFQKLVVADNLYGYVSAGLDRPDAVMGLSVAIAAVLYAVYLYCDFAGYSHIAIGCMQLLGYDVEANFRSPYLSRSIREFWRRWHISLSSFLMDYVYIPLGGSRCSTARCCANLLLTFLVSGLWHGTGLQFVVWGALHGVYLVAGRLTAPLRSRLWRASRISETGALASAVKVCVTFTLVCGAWVFFRAPSVPDALHLFARMADGAALSPAAVINALSMLGFNTGLVLRMAPACLLLFFVDFCTRDSGFSPWLSAQRRWVQAVFCYILLFYIIIFGPIGGSPTPVYFQF